jgi:hypothetical protein
MDPLEPLQFREGQGITEADVQRINTALKGNYTLSDEDKTLYDRFLVTFNTGGQVNATEPQKPTKGGPKDWIVKDQKDQKDQPNAPRIKKPERQSKEERERKAREEMVWRAIWDREQNARERKEATPAWSGINFLDRNATIDLAQDILRGSPCTYNRGMHSRVFICVRTD